MERHDQLVALVARMLALHRQRRVARTPHAQSVLQAQIDATDRQIDRLVYGLYGLTAAEIEVGGGGVTNRLTAHSLSIDVICYSTYNHL